MPQSNAEIYCVAQECDATGDASSTTVGQIIILLSNTKTTATTDYSYDGNGNLTVDKNKDISYIRYNHLNLPDSIVVTGKGNIRYIYDAAGSKLKKITTEGATTTTTLYMGVVLYLKTIRWSYWHMKKEG